MTVTVSTVNPPSLATVPSRLLIAVHGTEPRGWTRGLVAALPLGPDSAVRVLVVLDAPATPFPSLRRASAGTHAAARAQWRSELEANASATASDIALALPAPPDIVATTAAGDPGRAIGLAAEAWSADLVVVGRDHARGAERLLLGTIHDRVLATARCPVLVWPPRARDAGRAAGGVGSELRAAHVVGSTPTR